MWIQHLLSFIGSFLRIFFDAIGTTILGRLVDLAFAASVVVTALWKVKEQNGWRAMLVHWQQNHKAGLRFAAWCALVIYGPVIVWSIGKAVYEDHQTLVARSQSQRRQIHTDEGALRDAQNGCTAQIEPLKEQIAGLGAAKAQLESQNRDQQGQINTCILQQKVQARFHQFQVLHIGTMEPHMEYVLTSNVSRDPVIVTVTCDFQIKDGDLAPMTRDGETNFSLSKRVITPRKLEFTLSQAVWSPDNPLYATVILVPPVNQMPSCNFEE